MLSKSECVSVATDQEGRKSGSEDERSRSDSVGSLLSNGSATTVDDTQHTKDGHKDTEKEQDSESLTTETTRATKPDVTDVDLGSGCVIDASNTENIANNECGKKVSSDHSFAALPPSLAASLDPQQFKLDPPMPGKGGKITKESFENIGTGASAGAAAGGLSKADDPNDPFSGLDPLWSHKKS